MKSEQIVERYLCRCIKAHGGLCIKLTGLNGVPDRLAVLPGGNVYFIELKADGGRLSNIQIAMQNHLMQMGYKVATLWSIEEVNKFINNI